MNHKIKEQLVKLALKEDAPHGDITSLAIFKDGGAIKKAYLVAKQDLVLSGLSVADLVFEKTHSKIKINWLQKEGAFLKKGTIFGRLQGPVGALLKAERVALNFLQHLSGIATLTNHYVKAIKPYPAKILDTRKTIPGLRVLEKEAVVHGGGTNHRMNLSVDYLIKDNHIAACGDIRQTIRAIKEHRKKNKVKNFMIEIEVKNLTEFKESLTENPDIILLDNMGLAQIRKAVVINKKRTILEVSGGVNLKTVRKIASTGVARISIGRLTHSAPAVDISLEIES